MSINHSTSTTYFSALNSYLTFCKSHGLPVEPTAQTLSYYTTLQSFHINLKSIDSYLSEICNQLEPFFPNVCLNCKWEPNDIGTLTKHKSPLTITNLLTIVDDLASSTLHDNLLFNALLNTGFTGLL